jgi:hypothetical protein
MKTGWSYRLISSGNRLELISDMRGFRLTRGRQYVSASRDGINFLGGLTENGETMFLECAGSFSKKTTVRFFQSLQTRFGEKLLVVLDKGSSVTAKKLKEFADESKLELRYLPAGMAQRNPTEECWRQLRSALDNQYFGEGDELRSEIRSVMKEMDPPGVYQYLCR